MLVVILYVEAAMNKKLTLSVDNEVISRAKEYARDHNESLSEMVENYFRVITADHEKNPMEFSPVVNELLGSVNVPSDFNYQNEKLEYLERKHK